MALLLLGSGVSVASTTRIDALIDSDNNPASGCVVTTADGNFAGVDLILRTTVVADSTGYVSQGVQSLTCVGSGFGAPNTVDSASRAIQRGNGVGGSTAVELAVSSAFMPRGGQYRVGFTATGSDGLAGTDALTSSSGAPILMAAPAILIVPTLGATALVLLAGLVIGVVALARRRGYHGAQLVVVAIVVTALSGQLIAAIIRDGLITDWVGVVALATDAAGDSPAGSDIVAVFGKSDNDEVAFRVDVVLNATPTANAQSVTAKVGETLPITLAGSDFEGSALTYAIVTAPTQGSLGGSGANITYTPNSNATASDSFTFRVNDGQLDSTPATVTVTNTRAPAITSASSVTFTPTQANSFTVLANGMPTPTTTVTGCTLPASITFTADSNGGGTFSGNPTAAQAGAYTCTLTAANGIAPNATQSFTLTVGGAPTITSAATLPAATEGVNYTLHTLTATALLNTAPFQITSLAQTGTAPAGLSLGAASGLNTNAANAPFSGTPGVCSRGSYSFNFTATNSFGTTTQPVMLNVLARNVAPSFTPGANQSINEDAGAQTVNWATAISAGPSCESAQTVAFSVTNNNNALFSTQPAISPTGVLTYTPVANASGTATVTVSLQDSGGTANGGTDTSAAVNFTISVNSVNDAPSFTKGADQTVLEDSGPQTVNPWASAISAGPSDESAQTLTFNVTGNTNPSLFSAGPAVSPTGVLTYTPAANASGSATITLTLQDSGGTANGGVDTSAAQSFTITVTGVNDAPSFTKGADQTVLEDAGPQTVSGWATSISAGPNEASQTVTFEVTNNSNSSLFSVAPAVSPTGALSYTPAANANGSATITLRIRDNGGTANGGVDASATQTFVINVTPVNDAPSFVSGGNVTVLKDSGAYGPANWASAISAGPADESGQAVAFSVIANTNPALFSVAPALNGLGQLSFTPAPGLFGTAQITVRAQDNGGIANGGQDTSAPVVFTITVQSSPTITSANIAVFPLNQNTTFTITTAAFPDVTSITLTANPGPDTCVLPTGVAFVYTSGTTATLSGAATSATAVSCLVTATNGVNPPGTQVLSIIPGSAPALQDDGFILLNGTASPPGPAPVPWNVFINNGSGADDRGLPLGSVVSFGAGSLGGTAATNAAGATATTTTGGVSVNLLANGDLFVNAGGATNGTYTFDYVVQNAAGSDTATVTIVVGTLPTITGSPPNSATIGSAYGPFNFTRGGSPLPNVSLVSGSCTLPDGITLSSTGVVSGTPTSTATSASGCIARATNSFGTADSAAFSIAVTVPPPVVTTSGGTTTFTEDGPAVVVDSALTVTSAGAANLTGATATISSGYVAGEDSLSFTPSGGISLVSFNAGTGVLTLTGSASAAAYQTALRSVTFNNPSQNPSTAARTITFVASNATGPSAGSNKTINILGINDAPSFTKGADITVNEDSGAFSQANWATAISAGESGQTVSFNITGNTNAALFSAGPALSSTGTLTFTPAANANGAATITLVAQDNGGTANGGIDTSAAQTFTITVNPVNDAPSFTASNPPTVLEDSGAQSIANWATFSAGPPNESSQTVLAYTVSAVSNAALFSAAPAVAANGTLTYTPAANAFGTSTFTVTVQDNGGTANGGVDTSAGQVFTITMTGVNDAPSFTVGSNQIVNEDAGAQTVANWATAISAGPNESGQTLTFNVTGNTNPSLFSAGPVVAANGTLSYTPAANQNGVATITLTLSDNGGTLNGGADTSASQSFTITVNPVNDPPVALNKNGGDVQANMQRIGINASLLTGVTDADTGVNGCAPTFSVASITNGTNGTVSNVNLGTGTFDFEPAPGFTGTATVLYTVSDNGCPGTATSAPATISLNVVGPVVWFVNPAAASAGTGTLLSPFNSLAAANTAKGTSINHRIFVYAGTTAIGTGVTLAGGTTQAEAQWLIGQGATGASFDALMGITPPAGTLTRPTINGIRPTIQGTVTLGGNNVKAQGFSISAGTSTGLADAAAAVAGVSVSEVSVTTTTGTAVDLSGLGGTVSLTSVSANGAASGIVLTNTTGSFTVTGTGAANTGGTIQNTTGHGISLSNVQNVSLDRMNVQNTARSGINGSGTANFSFTNGTINNSGTAAVAGDTWSNIAFGSTAVLGNNLNGTLTVTGSTLTNAYYSGISVFNDAGTISNATITGNTITSSNTTANSKGFGIELVGLGNASTVGSLTRATISTNTITNFPSAGGIQVNYGNGNAAGPGPRAGTSGSATDRIVIDGNQIRGESATNRMGTNGILTAIQSSNAGSRASSSVIVTNNDVRHTLGTSIGVSSFGQSDKTAEVRGNTIVANNTVGSQGVGGGTGVSLAVTETPQLSIIVENNNVSQVDGNGILLVARGATGRLNAGVRNNTVAAPLAGVRPGIRIDAGNTAAGSNDTVCLDLRGNTSGGSGGHEGIGLRKQGTVSTTHAFGIEGMAATASPGVETYVGNGGGLNPGSAAGSFGTAGVLLLSATSGFSTCATAP